MRALPNCTVRSPVVSGLSLYRSSPDCHHTVTRHRSILGVLKGSPPAAWLCARPANCCPRGAATCNSVSSASFRPGRPQSPLSHRLSAGAERFAHRLLKSGSAAPFEERSARISKYRQIDISCQSKNRYIFNRKVRLGEKKPPERRFEGAPGGPGSFSLYGVIRTRGTCSA